MIMTSYIIVKTFYLIILAFHVMTFYLIYDL